jgi:hypothetical protein
MSAAQMMQTLWDAARLHLTDEELAALSSHGESDQLACISEVMEGIGCLVSADGSSDSTQAGNFRQASDVPTLLFTFAEAIKTASATSFIASEAEFTLRERRGIA